MRWPAMVAVLLIAGCVPGGDGSGRGGDDGDGSAIETDGARPDGASDAGVSGPDGLVDGPTPCAPACDGRACGADGCGGRCGQCPASEACALSGQCVPDSPDCGDGVCGADEDCATCAEDCGACCGNGACDGAIGETCATCVADCACGGAAMCTQGRCVEPRPEPPRILTFSTNVRSLSEGEQVVFSAVVTDPNGIDDLIGGVLESPEGTTYGAFASSGQEGAYGLRLTWAEIDQVASIDFIEPIERRFIFRFFDQGGLDVAETLAITLTCHGRGACEGVCIDLDTDPGHCGACGLTCDPAASCEEGACRCEGELYPCADGECVSPDAECDRTADCGDGSDEAGCCFGDGACGLGRICEENRCTDGCRAHEGCPEGRQCIAGACAPGCAGDADCAQADYCDHAGRCRPGCRDDAGCGAEEGCIDHRCVPHCRDDARCNPGRICVDALCAEGCRDDRGDRGCDAGEICTDEQCVTGCRGDRGDLGCAEGEICTAERCVPGCRTDDACAAGQICLADTCRAGCREDEGIRGCAEGEICTSERCVPGCRTDDACAVGEICEGDACRPGCREDAACAAEEICRNLECTAGCREDAVCGVARICEAERCVDGCRDDAGCDERQVCFEGLCRWRCDRDSTCRTGGHGGVGQPYTCHGDLCLPPVCGNGDLDFGEDCEPEQSPGCGCSDACEAPVPWVRREDFDFEGPGRQEALVRWDRQDSGYRAAGYIRSETTGYYRIVATGWCTGEPFGATITFQGVTTVDRLEPSDVPLLRRVSLPNRGRLYALEVQADQRPENIHLLIEHIVPALGDDCGPAGTDGRCPEGAICHPDELRCTPPIAPGGRCVPGDPRYVCDDGYCDPATSLCASHLCGDGVLAPTEDCDDLDEIAGDGCHLCRFDPFNGPSDAQGSRYTIDFTDGDTEHVVFINDDSRDPDEFIVVLDDYYHLRIETDWFFDPGPEVPEDCGPDHFNSFWFLSTGDAHVDGGGRDGCGLPLDSVGWFAPEVALRPGHYWYRVGPGLRQSLYGEPFFARFTRTRKVWACDNGLDDDGDGLVDLADPGCTWARDRDEADPPSVPRCADGIDNDGDGAADWPDEDGCVAAGDGAEIEHCPGQEEVITLGDDGGRAVINVIKRRQLITPTCERTADDTTRQQIVALSLTRRAIVEISSTSRGSGNTLTLRRACGGHQSNEIACHRASDARLRAMALDPGDYYIYVGTTDNAYAIELDVRVSPCAEDPEHPACLQHTCLDDDECESGRCIEASCTTPRDALLSVDRPGMRRLTLGELDPADPTWTRPAGCLPNDVRGGQSYEVRTLINDGQSPLTVALVAEWDGFDGYLHLFEDPFDAAAAPEGCIAGNDDSGSRRGSRLTGVELAPGQRRTIVLSSNSAYSFGRYTLEVLAEYPPEQCGDGLDNDADRLIDCADDDCAADPACAP